MSDEVTQAVRDFEVPAEGERKPGTELIGKWVDDVDVGRGQIYAIDHGRFMLRTLLVDGTLSAVVKSQPLGKLDGVWLMDDAAGLADPDDPMMVECLESRARMRAEELLGDDAKLGTSIGSMLDDIQEIAGGDAETRAALDRLASKLICLGAQGALVAARQIREGKVTDADVEALGS